MTSEYDNKPKKKLLSKSEREKVFKEMEKVYGDIFKANKNIQEIIIFGSASKKMFGEYVTPYKGRQRSDVDTIITFDKLSGKKIELKKGIKLMNNGYGLDKKGNWLHAKGHPFMIEITTSKNYRKNLDKPWPKGYNYSKDGIVLFSR